MTGIPEYGTGRHEDYLVQQEERAEVARDLLAEQEHAEWTGWMDAQGYATSQRQGSEGYGGGDMFDAFKAGMQAARDLDAAQEQPARHWTERLGPIVACEHDYEPWTPEDLSAALDSFYAWFTVTGGNRVQGQLLGADAAEFARSLLVGLESARAHREKGSPSS
jgi:hypothetical protein